MLKKISHRSPQKLLEGLVAVPKVLQPLPASAWSRRGLVDKDSPAACSTTSSIISFFRVLQEVLGIVEQTVRSASGRRRRGGLPSCYGAGDGELQITGECRAMEAKMSPVPTTSLWSQWPR